MEKKAAILPSGCKAPDFCLKTTPDQVVSLADFSGSPVVLVFYPADWSPVCGDELNLFNEAISEIQRYGARVLAVSVDNVWSHLAFTKACKFRFPLASDFEPKGQMAQSYGAYDRNAGVCGRALFLIDAAGVIRWSYLSPIGINPGVDGVLEALDDLGQSAKRKGAA